MLFLLLFSLLDCLHWEVIKLLRKTMICALDHDSHKKPHVKLLDISVHT